MFLMRTLIRLYKSKLVPKAVIHQLFLLSGADIPPGVEFGEDVNIYHRGLGVVLHPKTKIGNRVHILHGVTLGRADFYVPATQSQFDGFVIEDDVFLCAGASVLGGPGKTVVGRGTVVGTGAVLLQSTGEWEIWAGVPARKVADRTDEYAMANKNREDAAVAQC